MLQVVRVLVVAWLLSMIDKHFIVSFILFYRLLANSKKKKIESFEWKFFLEASINQDSEGVTVIFINICLSISA